MQTSQYAATIDVRQFIPRVKHQTIFGLWDALSAGAQLLLINDHDPKPLFYQLSAEYPDAFTWEYLEQGPAVWKVEITRTKSDL